MTPTSHLSMAGFAATAIAFGPARMGFGLFLPEFRQSFELSATLAGLIASSGFMAFLVALPLTGWLVPRLGPRVPVVAGAGLATAGFLTVAAAGTTSQLLVGVMLASTSAGLCWAPFNDAATTIVPANARPGVLSVIASGTSVGVILAAGLFLAVTYEVLDWAGAWLVFSMAGLLTVAGTVMDVPRTPSARRDPPSRAFPVLMSRPAAPLYVTALCFGAANAIFFSFAADTVVAAGGLPGLPAGAAAAVIFTGYGACGLLGIFTGRLERVIGLGWLLRAIFAAAAISMVLIALAPVSWAAVLISSGLQGAALMAVSAVMSFWSLRLFPRRGTTGFTAALVGLALGSIIGPATAGGLADWLGASTMFMIAGVPGLLLAVWPLNWPKTRGAPSSAP